MKTLAAGAGAAGIAIACSSNGNDTLASNTPAGEVPKDRMTYRKDKHGTPVSILGYGCMRLPTVAGSSGREDNSEIDQEQVNRLTDYAIEHGVNLFDTAPPYCKGRSEHAMGIALSRHRRDTYLISTKLSNQSSAAWSREASIAIYRNSLKELRTDYLDFLMLHSIGMPGQDLDGSPVEPMEALRRRFFDNGVLDFLAEEREAGRIRNLGFSYHGDVRAFDYLLSLNDQYHWDHVMIQHNYVDWNHAHEINERNTNSSRLYDSLEKLHIPTFVMEPLLGGRLAQLPPYASRTLKEHNPDASAASWAFRFAATQPNILTVLSGMTYLEHLQDNIRTYSPLVPLNESEQQMLTALADRMVAFPTVPCTGCQYCMPCPYGIDIPGIFAHYNKCLDENLLPLLPSPDADQTPPASAEQRDFRKARRRYLKDYDSVIPPERQADHCIACGKCLHECPQGIEIPSRLQEIDRYVDKLKQS